MCCKNCGAPREAKHAWGCPNNPNLASEATVKQIVREREDQEAVAAEEWF